MIDPITHLEIPDTGFYGYGTYVVTDYLRSRVTPDVVVASQVPDPRPVRLITVRSATTGGQENIALSRRRVIIHCFDATEALACRVAEMVRGYLFDGMYTRGSGFRSVTIIGEPAYFPDPEDPAKTPRAQLTADVLLRSRFAPYGQQ